MRGGETVAVEADVLPLHSVRVSKQKGKDRKAY